MLPVELVDHISSHVDSPKDLLALALTAKSFHALIVPNHLQFRHLRCDLRRKSLWNALAERPAFTSRFRSLELISETGNRGDGTARGAIVPKTLIDAGFDDNPSQWVDRLDVQNRTLSLSASFERDCINAIASSVRHMSNLTRFYWTSNASQLTEHPEVLFAALRDSCPNLDDLTIFAFESWNSHSQFDTASFPLWDLSHLTRVSVSVDRFRGPNSAIKHVPRMMEMLIHRCPSLQSLLIRYDSRVPICILPLLAGGQWPHLKLFNVQGDLELHEPTTSGWLNERIIEKFIERHPWLQRLPPRLRFPPLTLCHREPGNTSLDSKRGGTLNYS